MNRALPSPIPFLFCLLATPFLSSFTHAKKQTNFLFFLVDDMGMMDVLKEVVRPLVSVLAVEYIFQVSYIGFHNPMRSFSFMNFLIALAAKDLSVGGCAILAQNVDAAGKQLDLLETMTRKMRIASRFRSKKSGDA